MESGIYTLLPLAMRTLSKMKAIIKDELDGIGAQQIHIPLISGSDVWKKTGRWSLMGKEASEGRRSALRSLSDGLPGRCSSCRIARAAASVWLPPVKRCRRLQTFHGMPAAKSVQAITTLVGAEVSSYRQLPLRLYQINPKFRDEKRPRFGLLRCREFIMKVAVVFYFVSDLVPVSDACPVPRTCTHLTIRPRSQSRPTKPLEPPTIAYSPGWAFR